MSKRSITMRWQEMTIRELMERFERDYPHGRKDKEPESLWPKWCFYESGEVNALFIAYRNGYQLGVSAKE